MSLSVHDRVSAVATFRFIEVRLMEIVAAWTPTTPEMEVKVMFGRHIWDFAQHADALGKRTFELRKPEQFTLRPSDAYVDLLESVATQRGTGERLGSLYEAIIPGLERRYLDYIGATDPILDEPSIVIMRRIADDLRRQRREAGDLQGELSLSPWQPTDLLHRDRSIERLVVPVGATA